MVNTGLLVSKPGLVKLVVAKCQYEKDLSQKEKTKLRENQFRPVERYVLVGQIYETESTLSSCGKIEFCPGLRCRLKGGSGRGILLSHLWTFWTLVT